MHILYVQILPSQIRPKPVDICFISHETVIFSQLNLNQQYRSMRPGFHMSGKSQTIGNFTFCLPSQIFPIYRIFARFSWLYHSWRETPCLFVTGGLEPSNLGVGNERNPSPTDADVPDGRNLSFYLSGMITDNCRYLGRVGKIETLPILRIRPRSSQTIGDIYDLEFLLVGKIWDGRETVKSQTVWDFPDMWKPGFTENVETSTYNRSFTNHSIDTKTGSPNTFFVI